MAGWWLRVVVSQPGEGRRGVCVHDREMTDGDPPSRTAEGLREMLDWAVTQSPVHVALLGTDLRQLRLNTAMCRVLGLPDEAAGLGLRLTDHRPNSDAEACLACARQVIETGEPGLWRGSEPSDAGPVRAWEATLSPVKDQAGQVIGVLVISTDVTEQSLARERLALLNEASIRIGSTLDLTTTARELIDIAVPRLADFAMIDILDSVLRGDEPAPGPVSGTAALRRMACGSVLTGAPEAVAQPGQISSFTEGSPMADCLATGRSVSYSDTENGVARWARPDRARQASARAFRFHSMMMVPVRARGITLGLAMFVRHQRAEPFQDDDLVLAEEIVARAAVCIDNARRYTREHATALTLQNSLLQRRQPDQRAVEVATRYLPAHSGVAVGGDWFDVIRLSGSRVGLVVGDVVGHGVHAAATMGRLRTAVRTLADVDLEPEELLTRLDDVVTRLADEEELATDGRASDLSATCLYAVYDPVSRCCTLARAGHPVPAIVGPDGTAEFMDLPAGPPLGLGGLPFEETEIQLPEGSLLVLYTDGLIESRQRDIDAGLNAMRKVLGDVHAGSDGLRDGLLRWAVGRAVARRSGAGHHLRLPGRRAAARAGRGRRRAAGGQDPRPGRRPDRLLGPARRARGGGRGQGRDRPPALRLGPGRAGLHHRAAGQRAGHQRHPARPVAHPAPADPGRRAVLRGLRRRQHRPAPAPG